MRALGRWAARRRLTMVYFHGAGGSTGRGGGTIEEQAATWPRGSMDPVKLTVQGEMVERTFASPEILRSGVRHAAAARAHPPRPREPSALTRELARRSREAFEGLLSDPGFHALLRAATPYRLLGRLFIGSRPPKRGGAGGLFSVRAIPWVLCWTQVRLLLPSWYGVGAAWKALRRRRGSAAALRRAMKEDPLLRSVVRVLGFSLAKAEPTLWRAYARRLAPEAPPGLLERLEEDRRLAEELVRAASGGGLLWDRPWLEESIRLRAPMIHPLNLLQLKVLSKPRLSDRDALLLRETVTGIAAGMLTTG
jgi:phosphoenolpyruvate carboxylase